MARNETTRAETAGAIGPKPVSVGIVPAGTAASPGYVPVLNDLVSGGANPEIRATADDLSRARRAGEPTWMTEFRALGRAAWRDLPIPSRVRHLWRYTDPALFDPVVDPFEDRVGEVKGEPSAGVTDRELPEEARKAGVVLLDLATAAQEHPDRLRRVLGQAIAADFGKFEALNAAAFRGGTFLFVPRGVVVEKPIHVRTRCGEGSFEAIRLLVLVEENASVTLIEEMEGGPASGMLQLYGTAELMLEAGARVHSVTIQSLGKNVRAHLTQRARLARGASIVPILASFGGALVKTDTGARLEGDGSESEMTGVLSAVGRQRFDHHTLHHHLGRHTRSNLDYKTVLNGRTRSIYTGLIRIEAEAAFSQAYQENRNLLLSGESRADSIPELEIMTEEVSCTHGATVGPLDRDHLFYLMSRGLPEAEAVRMIVEGHFEPALRRLPEGMQDRLRATLRARLS